MMKKIAFLTVCLCAIVITCWSQNEPGTYDSSFRALYKAAALHPGRINRRGIMNDSIVRRWDKDIAIYVTGGTSKERKEVLGKLKNTIALLSPALNNKINISFTDEKRNANYLINLDFKGSSGWWIDWDRLGNIYKCILTLNTRQVFNHEQQADLVSHYFYQSLGDFVFNKTDRDGLLKNDPSIASNVSLWRQDINDIDLRMLKLHYSDDIKPGMAKKDIDQFFDKHSN